MVGKITSKRVNLDEAQGQAPCAPPPRLGSRQHSALILFALQCSKSKQ